MVKMSAFKAYSSAYIVGVVQEDKKKIFVCHILSNARVLNNQHSYPSSYNIQAQWCHDQLAMSAVGGGMKNSDMPAVYLLTLICGLSWILPWSPEVKKSPPGPELSAHRANLVKMNRITKQFTSITFNGCKALPRVFRSRHHAQGNRCALWIPPSCMALSLSSSLLLQMFSPFAI